MLFLNPKTMKLKAMLSAALMLVLVVAGDDDSLTRDDFPPDFLFGASTSAYQVEGAAREDGRTPSILDDYVRSFNLTGPYGDIGADQYHKYKEDVGLMAKMGLDAYRFSISWPRLIPNGKGPVNPKGLEYYNNLINELISHDIQPHVTLFHFDLPQALEDEYKGWLSRRSVEDFTAYADLCFREFGDRVKHWTTLNEPNMFVQMGYDYGIGPPHRCTYCGKGNSSTEPYLVMHNSLLAHTYAATLYREKYQKNQHGFVGINIVAYGIFPQSNAAEDISAAQRVQDFYVGWVLNPLLYGDYPEIMRKIVGSRLPSFTKYESNLVKGSIDFIGINFYYTGYAKYTPDVHQLGPGNFYFADAAVELTGIFKDLSTLEVIIRPWGLQTLLEFMKHNYGNIPIYIHENGISAPRDSSMEDWSRVKYLHAHIRVLLDSLRNGINVRGYFVWSFLDLLELTIGYKRSFGLYYIDLKDPSLRRQPRLSAHWYSHFLHNTIYQPKAHYYYSS